MSDQNVKVFQEDAQYRNDLLNAKSAADITAASERLMQRQSGVQRDVQTGRFVSPDANNNAGDTGQHTFSKTVEIAGVNMTFQADSAETLQFQIETAQQAVAAREAAPEAQQHPEPTQAEIDAEEFRRAARLADIELRFKRGELSAKDYLVESGAVSDYLAEQGIDVDSLREQVEERQGASLVSQWQAATEAFLKRSDWPGDASGRNQQLMLQQLQLLGLEDSPSVESLEAAYAALKSRGLLFPGEQNEAEVLDTLCRNRFGKDVKDCSPQELLEVWKGQQEGSGQGNSDAANSAFIASFRRRG